MRLETSLHLKVEAQAYWDMRLKTPYAMAPTHLVGQLDQETYDQGCAEFSRHANKYLTEEVDAAAGVMAGSHTIGRDLWIVGAGQLHDFGFVRHARRNGFTVQVADHSEVACAAVREFFSETLRDHHSARECVHLADIEDVVDNLDISVRWLHTSRVLPHLPAEKVHEVAKGFGRFLKLFAGHPPEAQGRITLIHADVIDNIEWVKQERWRTVHPFNAHGLLPIISDAAGQDVQITRSSESWDVFGERFTARTIMLAP